MNRLLLSVVLLAFLAACGNKSENKKEEAGKPARMATPVTVTQVARGTVQLIEESVGVLESYADPVISAEAGGKLLEVRVQPGEAVQAGQVLAVIDDHDANLSKVAAQAERNRVQALVDNQTRQVERQRELRAKNFISQAMLDDAEAQLRALQNQLAAAKAQYALSERTLGKTKVLAPFAGRIEKQMVVRGQFVKVGDPLFQLVASGKLRARLPFPETLADKIMPGMTVLLSTFIDQRELTAKIDFVKPMSGLNNRSFDALVTITDPGLWRPGSTVTGRVVLGEHHDTLLLPQHSVVLRPAGKVVYVVEGGKAIQRPVTVGVVRDGQAEIVSGLTGNETVVVDGAGFLTDQAAVNVTGQFGAAAASETATPASAGAAEQ